MGHCIHAIVAPLATAASISDAWPVLPRLDLDNGFVVFPVDANLIDVRVGSLTTPTSGWLPTAVAGDDEFMLLSGEFRTLLNELSQGGQLA